MVVDAISLVKQVLLAECFERDDCITGCEECCEAEVKVGGCGLVKHD